VPTYEYACKACGEPHEAVQSFHDAPLTECPHCGGELRKVFSSVGVVFKGSGFYRTDSRASTTSTSPAAKSSDSTSKDSTPKESAPKADPKPAAAKGSDSAA